MTNPRVMKEKLDNVDKENNENEVVALFVIPWWDFLFDFCEKQNNNYEIILMMSSKY